MLGISEPTPKVSPPLLAAVKIRRFRVYSVSFPPCFSVQTDALWFYF